MALASGGNYGVLIVPVHTAANLYNKEIGVELINVCGWGGMYLSTTDPDCNSWGDLGGKELYVPSKGSVPDILTQYFLNQHGLVIGEDVELVYSSHIEIAQLLSAGTIKYAVDAQPYVTSNTKNVQNYKVISKFAEEWRLIQGAGYTMPANCMVANSEYLSGNEEIITAFNQKFAEASTLQRMIYRLPAWRKRRQTTAKTLTMKRCASLCFRIIFRKPPQKGRWVSPWPSLPMGCFPCLTRFLRNWALTCYCRTRQAKKPLPLASSTLWMKPSIEIGRKFTITEEYFSLTALLGGIFEELNEIGKQEADNMVFLVPQNEGTETDGQYSRLLRTKLDEEGFANVGVLSPFWEDILGGDETAFNTISLCLLAGDIIWHAPYKSRGKHLHTLIELIRNERLDIKQLKLVAREISKELSGASFAKKVLAVGEFNILFDELLNSGIFRELENKGHRVVYSPFSEAMWMMWRDYADQNHALQKGFENKQTKPALNLTFDGNENRNDKIKVESFMYYL